MSTTPSAFVIELPEGSLAIHDLSLGSPAADAPVVLAVHGITANGLLLADGSPRSSAVGAAPGRCGSSPRTCGDAVTAARSPARTAWAPTWTT